jgi:hypothetical protein
VGERRRGCRWLSVLLPLGSNKSAIIFLRCLGIYCNFPDDPIALIDAIRRRSMKVGVAISPDTPSAAITDEVGRAADMLLVMTVFPGNSKFLE